MTFITIDKHFCFALSSSESQKIISKPGKIRILGVFPNTMKHSSRTNRCYNYSLQDIQLTQAMIYAVDHLVNENPELLPGIDVGFTIVDSCSSKNLAMSGVTSSLVSTSTNNFPQLTCNLPATSRNSSLSASSSSSAENTNSNTPIIGVIAEKNELITTSLASYTSSLNLPQISYNSYSALLENRKLFPYFYRTTSSLQDQVKPLFDIITYFKWNWISVVIAGSNAAENVKNILSTTFDKRQICVSVNVVLYDNYTNQDLSRAVALLKRNRRSNVVVLFGVEPIIYELMQMAQSKNLTGKTFIGTYSWMNSARMGNIHGSIVGGAIGIDFKRHTLKPFLNYLKTLDLCNNIYNPWFTSAWQEKSASSGRSINWPSNPCHLDPQVKISVFNEFYQRHYMSAFVIDAVLALAHALHKYLRCSSRKCPIIRPNQFLKADPGFAKSLSRVAFPGVTSNSFKFKHDGSSRMPYYYISLQPFRNATVDTYVEESIGAWQGKNGLFIDTSKIIWNGGHSGHQTPLSRCSEDCLPGYYRDRLFYALTKHQHCCWKCNKCLVNTVSNAINQDTCSPCVNFTEPNWNHTQCIDMKIASFHSSQQSFAVVFYVISSIFIICIILIWATIIKYRKTPVVKSSNFVLLNIFMLFNFLSVPSALSFLMPVDDRICQVQIFLLSVSEIGHVSIIICKANQIYLIFKMTTFRNGIRAKLLRNNFQIGLTFSIMFISHSTIVGLLIYQPLTVKKIVNSDNMIELMCDYKTNPAVLAFIIYFGILNVIALILAIRTRSLPDNYSEARYVFLSAMMVACVFSTSIPTIMSTNGVLNRTLACLSVFSVGFISIMCFVLPKMYIIYFHPELNTTARAAASVTNYSFNNQQLSPTSFPKRIKVKNMRDTLEIIGQKAQRSRIFPRDISNITEKEDI